MMSACSPLSRKYSPIVTPAYGALYCSGADCDAVADIVDLRAGQTLVDIALKRDHAHLVMLLLGGGDEEVEEDAAPEKVIVVPTMDRAHASRAEADRARRAKEAVRNQRTHAREARVP